MEIQHTKNGNAQSNGNRQNLGQSVDIKAFWNQYNELEYLNPNFQQMALSTQKESTEICDGIQKEICGAFGVEVQRIKYSGSKGSWLQKVDPLMRRRI